MKQAILPIGTEVILLRDINIPVASIISKSTSVMFKGEVAIVINCETKFSIEPWYTIRAINSGNESGGIVLGTHVVPNTKAGKVLYTCRGYND